MRKGMLFCLILLVGLGLFLLMRRGFLWGAITEGKWGLVAQLEDMRRGQTNLVLGPEGERFFLFMNVVQVGGTNYQCVLAVDRDEFKGRGFLATTTNRTFIWVGAEGKNEVK
ncbi:MAG TPA: hypothetical protein VF773_07365 [Verrucomicrobiae bacterium]